MPRLLANASSAPLLIASAAKTATGQSSAFALPAAAEYVSLLVNVSAVSGTTPSCTFSVQWSNNGVDWADADTTADAFAAITTTADKVKTFQVRASQFRLVWTISGTTPSFTFDVSAVTAGSIAFA